MGFLQLDDAKAQLNETGSQDDAEIQAYADAASEVVEYFAGPVESVQLVERHPPGWSIVLRRPPVLTLDAVEPEFTGGPAVTLPELFVDELGIVKRVDGQCILGPQQITYTAGRTVTPPTLALAARLLLQHWWATQRQGANMPRLAADDVLTIPGVAWSVPIRVKQLLDPFTLGGVG